jgi:hypothetical protein
VLSKFKDIISRLFPFSFLLQYRYFKKIKEKVGKVINKVMPDLIILGTDVSYLSLFAKKFCSQKIKVLVAPYSMCNQEEMIYSYLQKNTAVRKVKGGLLNRFLFPEWFKIVGGQVIECPATCPMLIQAVLGVLPKTPWVICGGNSDRVLVPSQFEADYYQNSSIQSNKIITYSPYVFKSFENHRGKDDYLLWSVPPDHINNKIFRNHREMIQMHLDAFASLKKQVILSLHPRLNSFFLNSFVIPNNVKQSDSTIEDLIAGCSWFVCSQSATIRFALQLKKSIINFKIYDLPYTEYSKLPMVINVDSLDLFHEYIAMINNGFTTCEKYDGFNDNYFIETCPNKGLGSILKFCYDNEL